jgi:hypothetical protein
MARTAASFCVFLTLETATFFCGGGAALRDATFAGVFFAFGGALRATATFLVGRAFVALRVEAFTAVARFAFGRAALGLITRFEAFAEARLPDGRDVDRRKPFVRLLLMC